jgi:hypothetical protein
MIFNALFEIELLDGIENISKANLLFLSIPKK